MRLPRRVSYVLVEAIAWTIVALVMAAMILAATAMTGCRADGLARTAASLETGYSTGQGELSSDRWAAGAIDEDSWAVWVSIHPFAALEPPTPVYEVPRPEAEVVTFQAPWTTEAPEEPVGPRPWWHRLDEVKGLLGYIGAGVAAFILLLVGKLGLDKHRERRQAEG